MGIYLSFLPFLDDCHKAGSLNGKVLVLGSQELHDDKKAVADFCRENKYQRLLESTDVRTLFSERYGIMDYNDCDINGKASLRVDISNSKACDEIGKYDCILDAGTLEHIFDLFAAFTNIHNLLSANGTIIHISPVSWYNHGFFNFNPKLFNKVYGLNKYRTVMEKLYLQGTRQMFGITSGPIFVPVGNEIGTLLRKDRVMANALYMAAFRKYAEVPFQIPYDE